MTDTATTSLGPQEIPDATNPIAKVAMHPGTPMYIRSDGTVDKAQSNASSTATVMGIAKGTMVAGDRGFAVYAGPLELTTAEWDAITGGSGGLTPGTTYYLDDSAAGKFRTSNGATQCGVAMSSTVLFVQIGPNTVSS